MSHYTTIQVCDDRVETSRSNFRAYAGVACCTVGALCFVAAVQHPGAQWNWAAGATVTSSGPAPTMVRSSVARVGTYAPYKADFVQEETLAAVPEGESFVEYPTTYGQPSHSQPTNATAMFGGLFLVLGAAVLLVRKMLTPARESLALLPTVGQTADTEDEIFTFNNLRANPGARKKKNRKGRGHGAGQGGSCGFGNRGQKSRSGSSTRPGFEGGQIPLYRKTPKLVGRPMGPGHKHTVYQMISIATLEKRTEEGGTITFDHTSGAKPVLFKIGGAKPDEEVNIPANLTVRAHAFTETARTAIEAAGGKCVVIDKYSRELDEDGNVVAGAGDSALEESSAEDSGAEGAEEVAMMATAGLRSEKVGKYYEPNPRSVNMPPNKVEIVSQVHELLKESVLVFGFSAEGFTVKDMQMLRNAMPGSTKIQIVKNTLFRIAARGTGFECVDPITMGMKAWVFVKEDDMQATIKAFQAFIKEEKKDESNPILGGGMEEALLSTKDVVAVGDMPTKKELIEKIARLVKKVTTKVGVGINSVPSKLAIAIRMATMDDQEGFEEALDAAREKYKKEDDAAEAPADTAAAPEADE